MTEAYFECCLKYRSEVKKKEKLHVKKLVF